MRQGAPILDAAFVAVVLVLLVVCLVVAAVVLAASGRPRAPDAVGGAAKRPLRWNAAASPHIVVDTLNLARWLEPSRTTLETAVAAIDATAQTLRRRHPGRVMYVVKDRDSEGSEGDASAARAAYAAAATRNGVYVCVVEKYRDPPSDVNTPVAAAKKAHSAKGRDDFYLSVLAYRWKCAVLTEDRLRDFAEFRATIPPFHVYEYSFARELPTRDFVRPSSIAYRFLRKPTMLRFEPYFGALKTASGA